MGSVASGHCAANPASYILSCISQLRSNILSPSTDPKLIETRLDVVAELVISEDRFKHLRKSLKGLERIDADRITGSIQSAISANNPQRATTKKKNADPSKESEKKLALMLQLRAFIKAIPFIKDSLLDDGGCKSAMLNTIGKILDDERLMLIDQEINDTLNEQVLSVSRHFYSSNRHRDLPSDAFLPTVHDENSLIGPNLSSVRHQSGEETLTRCSS